MLYLSLCCNAAQLSPAWKQQLVHCQSIWNGCNTFREVWNFPITSTTTEWSIWRRQVCDRMWQSYQTESQEFCCLTKNYFCQRMIVLLIFHLYNRTSKKVVPFKFKIHCPHSFPPRKRNNINHLSLQAPQFHIISQRTSITSEKNKRSAVAILP